MTNTNAELEKYLQAAVEERGQPISAGGPPLRSFCAAKAEAEDKAKFRAAAENEDGQSIAVGSRSAPQAGRN